MPAPRYYIENTREWKDTIADVGMTHFDSNDNTWYRTRNGVLQKAVKTNSSLPDLSNNVTWVPA